jgi:hypothetical protein
MKIPNAAVNAQDRARTIQQIQQEMKSQTLREVLKSSGINASDRTSLSVQDRPLELVYRAAIDKLNQMLEPTLGPDAIQSAAQSEMDFTPEATAERIVSLSTGFYEAFKAQHPGEEENAVLTHFMDVIRSGIEQGFAEARDILDGLGVLDGQIKDDVDRTYDLVQEGLKSFEQGKGSAGDASEQVGQ